MTLLAPLQHLKTRGLTNEITQQTQAKLIDTQNNIEFMWVPSHASLANLNLLTYAIKNIRVSSNDVFTHIFTKKFSYLGDIMLGF